MAIPYMGSKRKSAVKIYNTIKNFNPEADTLVDLFCGGFAISQKFIENGWKVIANDKNKYVIELIRKTIYEGLPEDEVTKFVTRSKFESVLKNPDKYEDWYVGFVMCIWSFGNNQKGYLFGKDTEPVKHAGHKLVIDKDSSGVKELIPQRYVDGILRQSDWHKRRMALVKVAKLLKDRRWELQQLQQLEQLERLQQLQQLERLQQLNYDEVVIPKGAVVYCDPPYQLTAEYKEGAFDHDKFWEWVRRQSKENKIYISEYQAPEGFKPILTFPQRSTLQGGNQQHTNQPDEKLFVPIGQEAFAGARQVVANAIS